MVFLLDLVLYLVLFYLSTKINILSYRRLPQLTAAIELVSEISRQLNERKNEAIAEITSTFEELERALHQRKSALIADLENICSAKQKVGIFHTCTCTFSFSIFIYVSPYLSNLSYLTITCSSLLFAFLVPFPHFHPLTWGQVLQAQLSSLLQGKDHIQSSCSFTEQALNHGSATEVGWQILICTNKLTNRLQLIWKSAIKCISAV